MARAMPEDDRGGQARPGRGDHHLHLAPPARRPQRGRRLAQVARHQPEGEVGGPDDVGEHHHAEGEGRGQPRPLEAEGEDPRGVDEQPGQDAGQRGHGLDHRAEEPGRPAAGHIQVDGGDQPEGHGEDDGDADHPHGAHQGVAHPAHRQRRQRAGLGHVLGVEVEVAEGGPAPDEGEDHHQGRGPRRRSPRRWP